jgi:hypothetical protein
VIILASCTLHNFCQLQGMLEPVVHDVQAPKDTFVGFDGMHILVPHERAKATGEEMRDALFKS